MSENRMVATVFAAVCHLKERQKMTPYAEGDESAGLSGSSQAGTVGLHPSINSSISTVVLECTSSLELCSNMCFPCVIEDFVTIRFLTIAEALDECSSHLGLSLFFQSC